MNGISVPMAIVDFIPVVMFFAAAVILQRDLWHKMGQGPFALLASGSVMVLISGFYKALWKILYALGICDWQAIEASFFPMMSPGYVLIFLAMIGFLIKKDKTIGTASALAVVPVYSSSLIFIILEVIGCEGFIVTLAIIAKKLKKNSALVLFILSGIFIMMMGYLGAKFDESSSMHWLAQTTNIIAQGALLWGTIVLHKAGLGKA
ncbi:MAG: hypothetical protein HUK24_05375 [Sphaerochaetaceae bacterium]|nr:hypothetical protein [Sphaerochaetaceae bacterium]